MNDTESILVLTSGVFMAVMYVILLVKGPRMIPFGHFPAVRFSTKELPTLIKFLASVVGASAIIGFYVNLPVASVGWYILLNAFIGTVTGAYLWLFHDDKSDKNKY